MSRRIVFTVLVILTGFSVFAQADTVITPKKAPSVTLPRSNDHFMFQMGYATWQGAPDSVNTNGVPRSINVYFLFDYPFKTNPRLSTAIGAGIATDNIYFKETYIDLKENATTLRFQNVSDTNHFKKYKLSLSYLEIPLELRFSSNPANPAKSWKIAVGVKGGTLINAHTKGKDLLNKNNISLNSYTEKENSKKYFSSTRFMGTARIGYGIVSLYGAYQLGNVLKDAAGPPMKLYQVGISFSGL